MNVIVCLDDRDGMMFNGRRLSMDQAIREDVLRLVGLRSLWMSGYTFKQFPENNIRNVIVDRLFLSKARERDYCFVEDLHISHHVPNIEQLIIYRWNRKYPSDFYFDIDMSIGWELTDSCDFPGYSHECITREVYRNLSYAKGGMIRE